MGELVEQMDDLSIDAKGEDIVNPWEVSSASEKGIDYDKLISKFQSSSKSPKFHNISCKRNRI